MSRQFRFYQTVTPVSHQRHANWSLDRSDRYDFARSVTSVPLTAVEIPHAAREYTIVFQGSGVPTPVVLLGVEENQNAYVQKDGSWNARYVPAFIRRYPFLFALSEDEATLTLCIDESFEEFNQEGRGQAFFDEKGERSPYLASVLEFLQDYQSQFARTERYCQNLQELGLLEPMKAKFTQGDKGRTLAGFQTVKREKLKALASEKLVALAKTDELELTYAHLGSLNNLAGMLERIATQS
jgi:hypothetical protein